MPDIPDYEPMLAAAHRAFAPELKQMVATLPLIPGMRVLDMACGDGFYSASLAEKVGTSGHVLAVDILPKYLEIARSALVKSPNAGVIEFAIGSIDTLPFEAQSFDACWCAQSFYSLPDPVDTVKKLVRITKGGGIVAALEADTLHHVLLPWPIELELALRVAELEFLIEHIEKPRKFYVGRRLREVFHKAGLEQIQIRSFATNRCAPLGSDEFVFLSEFLKDLSSSVTSRLKKSAREQFHELTDPESKSYLLNDPNLEVTIIDHVVWGIKTS